MRARCLLCNGRLRRRPRGKYFHQHRRAPTVIVAWRLLFRDAGSVAW